MRETERDFMNCIDESTRGSDWRMTLLLAWEQQNLYQLHSHCQYVAAHLLCSFETPRGTL